MFSYACRCDFHLVMTPRRMPNCIVCLAMSFISAIIVASENAMTDLFDCLQDGYDHSYFTISTFIDDHINHHAKALCKM